MILFENLFKPRQPRLAVDIVTDFVSFIRNLKTCFELTSSVLSTTSKQCFEQPAASFLVCSLIFIEYKISKSARNPRQDNTDVGYSFKKMSIDLASNL